MLTKIKNQRGGLAFEIIIGVLVLAMAGVVAYTALQNRNADTKKDTNIVATKKDPYAGWQTFTSKVNGLTFKYPADWKSDIKYEKFDDYAGESGTITSKDGFEIKVANNPSGLGGGCDDTNKNSDDSCPIIVTYSAVPVQNVEKTYLVKHYLLGAATRKDFNNKYIGLYTEDSDKTLGGPFYKQKESWGFPPYLIVSDPKKSDNGSAWIYGTYPETNPNAKLAPDKYYALPELKEAELIFKSLKFK